MATVTQHSLMIVRYLDNGRLDTPLSNVVVDTLKNEEYCDSSLTSNTYGCILSSYRKVTDIFCRRRVQTYLISCHLQFHYNSSSSHWSVRVVFLFSLLLAFTLFLYGLLQESPTMFPASGISARLIQKPLTGVHRKAQGIMGQFIYIEIFET